MRRAVLIKKALNALAHQELVKEQLLGFAQQSMFTPLERFRVT